MQNLRAQQTRSDQVPMEEQGREAVRDQGHEIHLRTADEPLGG